MSFQANENQKQAVENYRRQRGYEARQKAIQELVDVGLRESKSPLLARLKDELVRWAGFLCVISLVIFVAGIATSLLSLYTGAKLALVCLMVAIWLLGILEGARLLNGQSQLNRLWGESQ